MATMTKAGRLRRKSRRANRRPWMDTPEERVRVRLIHGRREIDFRDTLRVKLPEKDLQFELAAASGLPPQVRQNLDEHTRNDLIATALAGALQVRPIW